MPQRFWVVAVCNAVKSSRVRKSRGVKTQTRSPIVGGDVVLVECEVEVAFDSYVVGSRSTKDSFSLVEDGLVECASDVSGLGCLTRASTRVDGWGEERAWGTAKPSEERDAASHAVVENVVGVRTT